ncbi:alpha/beta hydrolase family protein [Actinoplanes sp. TFC3]|uniref:alpha/beta hydrolase n=1 Tax=Actinoplanes sp. TFC3 TaxID=1710355 RepID=UPI000835D8DB|nr:alpha/beta hydrolase family protein [Actinoplanes sp. TFC3]
MPLIRCDFYSEALELGTAMTVVLPNPSPQPPPVLYLLHGLTDDHTAWTRYTSIERYAADKGLAVVMPQVHRSFYADERYGLKFWTFLSEELPATVQAFFNVSTRREDTFVAGLSMGAYGAFKWALRQPERFAAAAGLSGALDVAWLYEHDKRPHIVELMARVYGDRSPEGTGDDLLHLLSDTTAQDLPELLLRCGTEDHTLHQNQNFVAACERNGIAIDAKYSPGAHEWGYWDREIRSVLDWLAPASHLQR